MDLDNINRILVPIDFSESSDTAIRTATSIALKFGGSIELLHVFDTPRNYGEGLLVSSNEAVRQLEQYVKEQLVMKAERPQAKGVPTTHVARQGNAHVEIVKHARQGGFDVIVMGTNGRGGFEYALLGSVAERVVQRSPCPVLVVPTRQTP